MAYECEYCKSEFKSKRSLLQHQQTTQYCLDIQAQKGVSIPKPTYMCECGTSFYRKNNYQRHIIRCISNDEKQASNQSININNNTNITNNTITNNLMVVNLPSFTMNDLTGEYILQTLTPIITREVAKQGIEAITGVIVEVLLKKDGKYCYCCTDKARKKFKMLIDENGQEITQEDPNALNLRTALSIPLQVILAPFTTESRPTKAILEAYEEAKTLQLTGQNFVSALAPALPMAFEVGSNERLAKLAEDFANDPKIKDQLAKADAKINAEATRDRKIANLRKAGAPESEIKRLCG